MGACRFLLKMRFYPFFYFSFEISIACWLLSRPNWRIVSKLTTDIVTYCTEASNQKSKYAYRKIFFYKKSTVNYCKGKKVWGMGIICPRMAAILDFCYRVLSMDNRTIWWVASLLPSTRQHPSYGDCLEVKRKCYQNSSVLDLWQFSQSAAHLYEQFLQVRQIGFVTLGPLCCV